MRAIAINPHDRTVTEIDHSGDLRAMYETMGCHTVCMVRLSPSELLWLDDNGALRAGNPVWRFADYDQPLAGIGLILGTTRGGRSAATRLPLARITDAVTWTDDETTGRFEPSRMIDRKAVLDGVEFGFALIGGAPILRPRTKAEAPAP